MDRDECDLGEAYEVFFIPDLASALIYLLGLIYLLLFFSDMMLQDIKIKLNFLGLIITLRPIVMFITKITQNEMLMQNDLLILYIFEGFFEMIFYYVLFKIKVIQVMIDNFYHIDEQPSQERSSLFTSRRTNPSMSTQQLNTLIWRLRIAFTTYSLAIMFCFVVRIFLPFICSANQSLVLNCIYIPV